MLQDPKQIKDLQRYCPVEWIGEWNAVHYYYAYPCPFNEGDSLVVITSGTHYTSFAPWPATGEPCPCPVGEITVFIPDQEAYKKQMTTQRSTNADPQVLASKLLHEVGMASYVGKRKDGGNPGEGEDFSSTFKAKVAVKQIHSDGEDDHDDTGVKRRYRLLEIEAKNPNHPDNTWRIRIGMQRQGAKKEPYSDKIRFMGQDYYVLRPNKHVGGG